MAQFPKSGTGYSTNRDTSDISVSAVTPAEDARSVMINQVSWGAIFAGAVIAVSAQVVLNMAGVGVGAATLDPGTGDNPTAGAFGIGAGIWFAISTILAALIGGVAAGRLSGKPKPSTAGWHGLTAWAVSTIFVIYLIGSSVTSLVGGAVSTVGNVERWSGFFDQFAASLSSGMGFMSGGGFQVQGGGIIGLSWRQQPMR